MDKWMDRQMDGCMDGWIDRQTDGWMDRWMDKLTYLKQLNAIKKVVEEYQAKQKK